MCCPPVRFDFHAIAGMWWLFLCTCPHAACPQARNKTGHQTWEACLEPHIGTSMNKRAKGCRRQRLCAWLKQAGQRGRRVGAGSYCAAGAGLIGVHRRLPLAEMAAKIAQVPSPMRFLCDFEGAEPRQKVRHRGELPCSNVGQRNSCAQVWAMADVSNEAISDLEGFACAVGQVPSTTQALFA